MRTEHAAPVPTTIELAIMGLQQERCACVSRLTLLLKNAEHAIEAQGYMRRIANINQALIRLSRAEVVMN
jgi:hypothetical protein